MLCRQGQFQPRRHPHPRPVGRRRRRALGGRASPGAPGRRCAREHRLFRRRQIAGRIGAGARGGHRPDQCRIRARDRGLERTGRRQGRARAGGHPRQPRRRRRDPREDHHRHQGKQVRHRFRSCPRGGGPCGRASGHRHRRRRRPYRLAAHRSRPLFRRLPSALGACRGLARRRPRHPPPRSRRRPRHPLPRRDAADAEGIRGDDRQGDRWARLGDRAGAGAGDYRRRRGSPHPGSLRQEGGIADLRDRRRGDERPHAAVTL